MPAPAEASRGPKDAGTARRSRQTADHRAGKLLGTKSEADGTKVPELLNKAGRGRA